MTKSNPDRACGIEDCGRPHEARGMCAKHYKAWRKQNLALTDSGRRTPPAQRFWLNVEAGMPDECWLWTGGVDAYGYGSLMVDGKTTKAHRYSYFLFTGLRPDTLDHLCRNRRCVNWRHLDPVSRGENVLRGTGFAAVNKSKTHCPNGHEYDHVEANGHRRCKECRNAKRRERYRQLKQ